MKPIVRALAYLWALPGTVAGLLLGATMLMRPRIRDGVITVTATRGFAAVHRRLGYASITFGHVILSSRPLDDAHWKHELAHVRQWEVFGPLMFVVYPLASIAGYRRNPFEAAARRRAGA